MQKDSTTNFGFEEIPAAEKQGRVGAVFSSVAGNYDLMNDVMSFGVHHLWKKFTIEMCGLRPGHKVLDLAGGTGDLDDAKSGYGGDEISSWHGINVGG